MSENAARAESTSRNPIFLTSFLFYNDHLFSYQRSISGQGNGKSIGIDITSFLCFTTFIIRKYFSKPFQKSCEPGLPRFGFNGRSGYFLNQKLVQGRHRVNVYGWPEFIVSHILTSFLSKFSFIDYSPSGGTSQGNGKSIAIGIPPFFVFLHSL